MPHLVQMDKRYGEKGLQIIGAEVQLSTKDAITKVTDEYKVKFPITKGIQGPSTGRGIPRAIVFDMSGKVVFTGHPADDQFERAVKKALRERKKATGDNGKKSKLPEVSKPLVAQRSWTNTEGKKITASVLSSDGENVEFKLSNGKKVKYPITKLSESDQELVKKASEAKAEE